MRFYGIALLASTAVLGACGGEKAATDTAAANAAAAAAASATTPAPAPAPAAATPAATMPAAGAVAAAPATGATHEVKMIGDATGYKFEPANLTIKQGDAVKFVMVSMGPHNVAFQGVTDAAALAQLDANTSAGSWWRRCGCTRRWTRPARRSARSNCWSRSASPPPTRA